MQPIRQVGIPIDFAIAEMAAFPLASEFALRTAVTELRPDMSRSTGDLWQAAERVLLVQLPGFSVDEAVALRDKMWFGDSRTPSTLGAYLRRLAETFLEAQGTVAVPRYTLGGTDDLPTTARFAEARRRMRWLGFALPYDLLLAALHDGRHRPTSLELLTRTLERQLGDCGVAETHLHMGSGLDFPTLWVGAVNAISLPSVKPPRFASPGAQFEGGTDLAWWLLLASMARYLLGAFLGWRAAQHVTAPNHLSEFLLKFVPPRLMFCPVPGAFPLLVQGLDYLIGGRFSRQDHLLFARYQALYRHLAATQRRSARTLDDVQKSDPLSRVLAQDVAGGVTPEMAFVASGLRYLQQNADGQKRDELFSILFWQVVRARTLFYRHVVQRPMTPGLQWFTRFYARLRPARDVLSSGIQLESAARLGGIGYGLRSLEVRTSPSKLNRDLSQFLDTIDRIYQDRLLPVHDGGTGDRPFELGVVLHFTKDRGGGATQGRPQAHGKLGHADPCGNPTGYRFAKFYAEKRREATTFAWMLKHYPLSLQLLRGVDVCTDELGVPNWVFSPLLRHVRQAAVIGAKALRHRFGLTLPPLRTTIHAGEDFVHLQTGLRLIDEALDHLDLREGDRIGHGVALGIDPYDWASRAGRLPLTVETRLLDLVWEWEWYGRKINSPSAARPHALNYELSQLS
ncbi:MAG: hypothetical protein JSS02_07155, partial [Planctomycetes bacterium]|nr:hypothetical protein [Planctomycetota bacterium]